MMATPEMTSTKTWGAFFDPYWGGGARWRPFRFRPPSWMTSFPEPEMRSSKMAAGSGRVAILRLRLNGGRKTRPILLPITVYRAGFWERAVPLFNATCCFLWCQPFVSYSMVIRLILGCLWPLVSVLNYILTLGILRSVIFHLPGCFCPWISDSTYHRIVQNIGFNIPSDSFMSHLYTQLEYSTGEFQASQLIVLAVFGVVD